VLHGLKRNARIALMGILYRQWFHGKWIDCFNMDVNCFFFK
jgi:hypothetical protein